MPFVSATCFFTIFSRSSHDTKITTKQQKPQTKKFPPSMCRLRFGSVLLTTSLTGLTYSVRSSCWPAFSLSGACPEFIRVYPRVLLTWRTTGEVLLTWLEAGECVLTCFGVYPSLSPGAANLTHNRGRATPLACNRGPGGTTHMTRNRGAKHLQPTKTNQPHLHHAIYNLSPPHLTIHHHHTSQRPIIL